MVVIPLLSCTIASCSLLSTSEFIVSGNRISQTTKIAGRTLRPDFVVDIQYACLCRHSSDMSGHITKFDLLFYQLSKPSFVLESRALPAIRSFVIVEAGNSGGWRESKNFTSMNVDSESYSCKENWLMVEGKQDDGH